MSSPTTPTTTPESVLDRALEAVHRESYNSLYAVEGSEIAIHTRGVCGQWAYAAKRILQREASVDPLAQIKILQWDSWDDEVHRISHHRFVAIRLGNLNELILDGTWQQFLTADQRTDELPRLLTGTLAEVMDTVLEAGLASHYQEICKLPDR